jgi:integrase
MRKRNHSTRPPSPRFFLAGKVINIRFSYTGIRMSISINQFIEPEEWDQKRQRPKSSLRGRNDLVRIGKKMMEWENVVISLYRDVEESLTPAEFKQEILYRTGAEDRPGELPKDLHGYIVAFIEAYKKRPGVTRTSWGKFESLHRHLLQFEKDYNQRLDFNTIDWQFKDDFTSFMYAAPRNFGHNNASKMMASLRHIMRDAFRKKAHGNRIQEDASFSIKRVATKNKVRLTVAELYQLEQFDFSDRPRLEEARDLMLFASWTGLRISDWFGISRASLHVIEGKDYLKVVTQKSKTEVVIPIAPVVAKILEKYAYKLPVLPHPVFNLKIKQVCKEAIPNSTFNRIYSEGGQLKKVTAYKYEFVSSHAGRRSFASNLYEASGRAYPIMQITGHSSEAMFQKYVDLKTEETVKTLRAPLIELASWQPK